MSIKKVKVIYHVKNSEDPIIDFLVTFFSLLSEPTKFPATSTHFHYSNTLKLITHDKIHENQQRKALIY